MKPTSAYLLAASILAVLLGATAASAAPAVPQLGPALARQYTPNPLLHRVAYGTERILAILKARGYEDTRIVDETLPIYVAEGCLGGDKLALSLSRWGDILNRRRIGSCTSRNRPEDVAVLEIQSLLEGRGFSRLKFIVRTPPEYVVEACRNDNRYRLTVTTFGDVRDRTRLGKCRESDEADPPPVVEPGGDVAGAPAKKLPGLFDSRGSKEQIVAVLTSQGYSDVSYVGRFFFRYRYTACQRGTRYRMVMNRFGEVRKKTAEGQCAGDYAYVDEPAPQPVSREDIRRTGSLKPERCQEYFDWLLYESKVLFDVGSAKVRRDSFNLLGDLAYVATRCPEASVEVSGHTDSDGSEVSNQDLSERRAESVSAYLQREGIRGRRLFTLGYGELRPVQPNTTTNNKQANRRIEFTVRWE